MVQNLTETIFVTILYPKHSYTSIKHERKIDIYSVVSNIGGLVSLWLGCSLISFAQCLIYLTMASYGSYRRKRKQNSFEDTETDKQVNFTKLEYKDDHRLKNLKGEDHLCTKMVEPSFFR
jgi:hypothetical protein